MTNTMDFNSKEFKELSAAAMKALNESGAKLETLDDMYAAVSKYVNLTKEQFTELYNQAKDNLEKENPFESKELAENELDMVVGGMPGWLKNTLIVAGCVLATALVVATAGAAVTAGTLAFAACADGGLVAGTVMSCSTAAVTGAIGGAIGFGTIGALAGIGIAATPDVRQYYD